MTIKLIGGPWDGRRIEDLGAVRVRMGIAKEWQKGVPKIGTLAGTATYEPDKRRMNAFWLENNWDGVIEEIIEP